MISFDLVSYKIAYNGSMKKKMAMNFECKLSNGMNFELSENLKKGPVVLIFILGTWCPRCTNYMKSVEQMLRKTGNASKSTILFVSKQNRELLQEFKAKKGLNVMMTADEEGIISQAYGVTLPLLDLNLPLTVVINQNGEVISKIGFEKLEKLAA